jgi:hypothetical protein
MDAHVSEDSAVAKAFFDEVERACRRIVLSDNNNPEIESRATEYVIEGRTIIVRTRNGDFPFWVGLNGPRIFFIAYVADIEKELAQQTYKFTFGGAAKIGWAISCESLAGGVSIWGTLDGDFECPLAVAEPQQVGPAVARLTKHGRFWAVDIAMMVQSWVRTSQRANITRHELDPAPL